MLISKKIFKYGLLAISLICIASLVSAQEAKRSYDYASVKSHPRLLLDIQDEETLRKAIDRNDEFKIIDRYIREQSEAFLTEKPLERVMQGKRLLAVSRKALTRLYYLSYSYRMTKDRRFLDRAVAELDAVCAFTDWNPSHFLDVGEMCMGIAIAYDWLYADLPVDTKTKVRKAITEKAFAASYHKSNAWFLTAHSNWNSVCNAGLVFGALAILEDESEASIAILERALESNKLPLQAYAPHGNYPEGPGYWNYGTTFQVMLIAALESALGSDLGLSKSPGFMETAQYMLFSAGPSGFFYNYYDGGRAVTPSSSLFWFADKMKDPTLVYQEIPLIRKGIYTRRNGEDERILPNALIFGKNMTLSSSEKPTKTMFSGQGITPITIVRISWDDSEVKYLGIKGGKASDGHAHMDQGSFVYDVGKLRWAMDFGLQSYITLESKGVDLWNMGQKSQRWDVFRYNNLNHNTLTINNQRHNINGKAEITETFDTKEERGAKVDITAALNLDNELKSAIRKAVIVNNEFLKVEDIIETNCKAVDLRWNMVTPATAKIVDDRTISLTQSGKTMLLHVSTDIPFKLAIRPSENPKEYINEFNKEKYGDYNHTNKGSVMVGFDAQIPANKKTSFVVTLKEVPVDLALPKNVFVLDAPNPSTASEGNNLFSDSSPIGISGSGELYPMETPDWNPFGKTSIKKLWNKSFRFNIHAKRIAPEGLIDAGIDRSNDGQLGVRGGDGNGIDPNEGYVLGLDLRDIDKGITFQLTKIAVNLLDKDEACTIVNRKDGGRMMIFRAKDKEKIKNVKITSAYSRKFVDVSGLGLTLKGGGIYEEILSLFNTSESGSFRIAGFEFVAK